MKNILTTVLIAVALAAISNAQSFSRAASDKGGAPSIAVVEFTPGPNAPGMTAEAKRHFQASIAASLAKTRKFDVYDTRHTRNASQADLAAVNGTGTTAAVKVGKQLGVSFVLTGNVVEYNTRGSATVRYRIVNVATGKVTYSSEIVQQATMKMTGNAAAAEMQAKVLKPLIQKLTAEMTGL